MLRTKTLCRHTFLDGDFSWPPKWQSGKQQVNTHARLLEPKAVGTG
jgi:hypothetical protein